MSQSFPLVTIGVCTYKRPEAIAKCLKSLIDQQTSIPFDIVVTENDASQGSKEVIEQIAAEAKEKGIEIRYYCEPIANISIARNRCVAECRGEFLAFIDDDEWAEPDWLEKLVEVQREYNADVVWGDVLPEYPPEYPEYLKHIGDIRDMFTEGQILESASTNSTLYRQVLLQLRDEPFDVSWGRTSGEDSELAFFLYQTRKILIVKTYQARVHDMIPISRARIMFIWRRTFRESMIGAKLFVKYYYRMMGFKVNAIHCLSALGKLFCIIPQFFYQPRVAFVKFGSNIAVISGILSYYLGCSIMHHE